jgi:signal recognition particle receptor subunit beta
MVFLNYTTMQVTAKVVYYGPGLCGKTTNLQWIHRRTAPASRGEMVSLETETDRTLFFDLLPLDVGMIGGMKVRLQLYTVPGQVFYNATRRLVLKGVDGIVFVADSQVPSLEANEESLANLHENLVELGLDPAQVPLVFQYNKRDLSHILPVAQMEEALNPAEAPAFEAAAIHGVGVFETLKEISRHTLDSVRARLAQETVRATGVRKRSRKPAPAESPAAVAEPEDPALLEPLQIEFAEEDTDKVGLRPVRTQDSVDIGKVLDKLRAPGDGGDDPAPASLGDGDVDRLIDGLVEPGAEAEQALERRATLDLPERLLRGLSDLRVHLCFDRGGHEETLHDALHVTLVRSRGLRRLRLRLDLDLKAKG